MVSSCSTVAPSNPNNACSIFDQKRGWEKAVRKAGKKWGLPPHIALAFVHRESHYVADAKPPRRKHLGFIPGKRLSSAYGYAQATDETWKDYRKDTGKRFVDRDNFADAIDFIGWYNHRAHRTLGIGKSDAYHLYLAYYSGLTGYRRGVWKKSPTIKGYANKVSAQAARYQQQLRRC